MYGLVYAGVHFGKNIDVRMHTLWSTHVRMGICRLTQWQCLGRGETWILWLIQISNV